MVPEALAVSLLAPSARGGIERYLHEIAARWPGLTLLSPGRGLPPYGPSWPARLTCQLSALRATLAAARRERPRCVLYPQLALAWQGPLVRAALGIPFGVWCYGVEMTGGRGMGLKHRALRAADFLVADSHHAASVLRGLGARCPIRVAHPGVDFARFADPAAEERAAELRLRWGLEGKRVVVTVARLAAIDRYKGHDAILGAAALLKDHLNLACLIVGEGDDRPRLEALARELGVSDRAVFAGWIADEDLPACYALGEVYAMPSRGEGFGIAFLEAQAAGRPVVALRAGGAPEALRHGETGLLLNRDDAETVAGAIQTLLDDPDRARAMGLAGAESARGFSWDATARAARAASGPVRAVFLSPVAILGGAERCLLDLLSRRDRERVSADLICPEPGPLIAAAEKLCVTAELLPLPGWALRVGREPGIRNALLMAPAAILHLAYALRVAAVLRRRRAEVLVTNGNKAHLWGRAAAALARCRLVALQHDFPRGASGALVRSAACAADLVVTNSAAVAASFPFPHVHVVPNGVDLVRFRPDGPATDLKGPLGLPASGPLVGMVGVLAPWKGHDVFLGAAARVLQDMPTAGFLIVGDEAYQTHGHAGWRAHLQEEARRLGVAHAARFLGWREDVPEILRALDIAVHASVRPEPFGRVLAEAQACGIPVVAARGGGTGEVVAEGETGLLVAPGDEAALAAAILALLADAPRRRAMGAAGAARMHARLGLDAVAASFWAMFPWGGPDGPTVP